VWFHEKSRVFAFDKPRTKIVTSFVRSSGRLPKGLWRCELRVSVRRNAWRTVKQVSRQIR
jgi:hypothetical protein